MEMTDAFGNLIFESIKITLVCGTIHAAPNPNLYRSGSPPSTFVRR